MTFTADQYDQLAEGYEKAAADPLIAAGKQEDLAKKADWFKFLARRERVRKRNSKPGITPTTLDAEPITRGRSRRSITPFLTTLWLTGAVVYLITTLLFTNAINLFGTEEPNTPAPQVGQSAKPPLLSGMERNTTDRAASQVVTSDERHAISPDQPTYESPSLTIPAASSVPPQSAEPEEQELAASVQPTEMLTVAAAATIRNGPSRAAKKIGTAKASAELQVLARKNDWVQFVDPSSGNTGWILSSLLVPASRIGADGLAAPKAADKPTAKRAKPKLAKKKPPPAQRARAYADLPSDEEFFPPRKRDLGLLNRRRLLRQGLMSPDFVPPD